MADAKHHLILIREIDSPAPAIPLTSRAKPEARPWDGSSLVYPDRRERMQRMGEIYTAVRLALKDEVEITVVDPRNLFSFVALVIRDALRYGVPVLTALRALGANRPAAAVFDGQVLFEGKPPPPEEVIGLIRGRLVIHRT